MLAKQQYFGTIGIATTRTRRRRSQEATFYGLPFYAIGSRTEPAETPPVTTDRRPA